MLNRNGQRGGEAKKWPNQEYDEGGELRGARIKLYREGSAEREGVAAWADREKPTRAR